MDQTEHKIDNTIDMFTSEWEFLKVIGDDSQLYHQLTFIHGNFLSMPEDFNSELDAKLAQQSRRKR